MTDMSADTTAFAFSPAHIGQYRVLGFHGFSSGEAVQIHVECRRTAVPQSSPASNHLHQKLSGNALAAVQGAVVLDHAYLFSLTQLCVGLHRLDAASASASTSTSSSTSTLPEANTSSPIINLSLLCKALAVSHNTKSLINCLPAGPETTAVVVVWRAPQASSVGSGKQMADPTDAVGSSRKRSRSTDSTSASPSEKSTVEVGRTTGETADDTTSRDLEHEMSQAILQAVRRVSRTAVLHPLAAAVSTPCSSSFGSSHRFFYPCYADMPRVQSLYCIPDTALSKVHASGKTQWTTPSSPALWMVEHEQGIGTQSHQKTTASPERTTRDKATSDGETVVNAWDSQKEKRALQQWGSHWMALESLVINKLATYDV